MRYTQARNNQARLVKKDLSRAHRRRVQQVIEDGPRGMWRLAKWARNRSGAYEKGLTPSLKVQDPERPGELAETVDQKAEAFRAAFFPQPPPADLSDTASFQYPEPIEFPPITTREIHKGTSTNVIIFINVEYAMGISGKDSICSRSSMTPRNACG